MRFLVLFLSLLLPASTVANNTVKMDSFAYGYVLKLDNTGPVYELDVPEHIYQTVTQSNYADVRVFNANGDAVPHLLRHEKNAIKEKVPATHIPFFPMKSKDDKGLTVSGSPSIRIETNPQGAIVNIEPQRGNIDPASKEVADYYILDVSQLKTKPQALSIQWQKDHDDFNETILISGSDDLANWKTLVARAPITNLRFAGHHIIKRRIELGAHDYKYLSLRWSGKAPLKLASIMGHFDSTLKDRKRNIITTTSDRFDEETRRFFFNLPGHYPVDKVTVKLSPKNAILLATVSSRNNPDVPWGQHFAGLIYNLEKDGESVLPPVINLARNTNDKYWRMTATEERDGLASMAPALELGWLPHKLVFIAQGNPPFTLAYGHSQAKPVDNTALRKLLQGQAEEGKTHGLATLDRRMTLSGTNALQPVVDNSAKWKTAILWGVLVLGLLALLIMVMRLYKQMDTGEK